MYSFVAKTHKSVPLGSGSVQKRGRARPIDRGGPNLLSSDLLVRLVAVVIRLVGAGYVNTKVLSLRLG